ncbi:MAG: hypothetical protein QOE11_819 [Solirubrobacteraceae bacterium]|jgi:hypothetical protein|nr:hypothetical protein [Solirubrobacteraceae bacterium]
MEQPVNPQPRRRRRRRGTRCLLVLATCLLAAAVVTPVASARTLQKGFWGPAQIDGVSQFPTYKQLGVTLYQMALPWDTVAPTRPANPRDPADPAYQWPAEIDGIINEARANGMTVMLMIIGAPAWANGGHTAEYAPTKSADYANFARAASRRYPAVRRWMIWGEPTRAHNWKPIITQPFGAPLSHAAQAAPRRYARLLDAAYGQLKAQSRSNIVIGGNTFVTGEIRPTSWAHYMRLPDGRPPRMDLYGHNPFSFREPDLRKPPSVNGFVDFSDLRRFDAQIQRDLGKPRHKRIRLFLSEFAIPTDVDFELNFHVTPATQAKWITSAFKVAHQVHADTLGWIRLRDDPPDPQGRLVSHGGLMTADGTPKPGFFAFMRAS